MGTYVEIDSTYIDLTNYKDNTDQAKCEHFSLRGYVSEMRKKDWKKCWPFPVNESEEQPTLPPLEVPKFKWWACESCRQATAAEGTDKDDQIDLNCSNNGCRSASNYGNSTINSGIQEAPMTDSSTPVMREIDLNILIDLSSDNDCEIENNAKVLLSRIIDPAIGLENKPNRQVSSVGSPEVCPGLVQEVKRDKQCREELRESCAMLREGTTVTQQDNVTEDPIGHLPPKLVVGSDVVSTGNTDTIVNNDCHDHHPERFTGLSRKGPRKMRLMTDMLSENGDPKTGNIARNGSTSHPPSNASSDLLTLSILPDKVDVQGDMTLAKRGQGRKRKLLLDEESDEPTDMCYQRIENEVQNVKGDAKTIDTVSDNRSKDVHVGKKSRKIQHVDNDLISKPHQEQHRENGDTLDIANKECASKTVSSELFLHVSTEKGNNDFPLHALRTKNVRSFSKGEGKMVQADEELDSLSCRKNDRLVDDSFAHTGAKNMSNIPVSIPILSAQGAQNGEGLEEGLHLSLSCYPSPNVGNEKGIHHTESRHIRKNSRINIFRASSHITNALSGKGKEVLLEEINEARNKDKTSEVLQLGGMKRFYDLTVEESDQCTFDDVPLEVVEIMSKSTQKRNQSATDRKNGTITIQENVLPQKGNLINYFYPFAGNQFGVNNLCKTQSPCGFDVLQSKNKPSSGVYFSPMDTIKCFPSKFNRSIAESGSSDASLQAKGVPNMLKTILHQGREASHPWPTLGYDVVPRKAFSQPSKSSMDLISLRSGLLYKQIEKRDFHLNYPNFNVDKLQNCGRKIGHATLRRTDAEYRFPGKQNVMEAHQNPRGSFDMHSNEAIHAMHLLGLMDAGRQSATSLNVGVSDQMLKRPFYPGECSTKLDIGKSNIHGSKKRLASDVSSESDENVTKSPRRKNPSSSNSAMQSGVFKQLSGPQLERETPELSNSTSENLCMLNRNPADFTMPDEGNAYTVNGGDMIFEDNVPQERSGIPTIRACRLKRNHSSCMQVEEKPEG